MHVSHRIYYQSHLSSSSRRMMRFKTSRLEIENVMIVCLSLSTLTREKGKVKKEVVVDESDEMINDVSIQGYDATSSSTQNMMIDSRSVRHNYIINHIVHCRKDSSHRDKWIISWESDHYHLYSLIPTSKCIWRLLSNNHRCQYDRAWTIASKFVLIRILWRTWW